MNLAIFKKILSSNKGLRYKLMLAFSLMSVIPILASVYLISIYLFPQSESIIEISTVIIISLLIAILGLALAKGLIDPVINMAFEAKMIASGEYERKIAIASDDEVGHLGESINSMTQKIKSNLDELKGYGQKMREINVDIHKKVLALTSLLQIGDVISTGSMDLSSVLELSTSKVAMLFEKGFGIFYMPKVDSAEMIARASYNTDHEKLKSLVIKPGSGLLGRLIETNSVLVADSGARATREIEEFRSANNVKNFLAVPIYSGKRMTGLLFAGTHHDDYKFRSDDIDLIKVFAKQIAIAIENEILVKKTEELAIKDNLTELYNKKYILTRLEEEIKRSIFYQRPCSFVVFGINDFSKLREIYGDIGTEEILKKLAKTIKDNTSPISKAARLSGDEFAMLLPEKNKRESTEIADDIKRKIELANLTKDKKMLLTVSAGVAENPIDGATCEELLKKAEDTVKAARSAAKDRTIA